MRVPFFSAIVAIGDELTTGRVTDTNGSWLATELTDLGTEVINIELVRDRIEEIVPALDRAAQMAKLVVVTGGLGPTADDLTRDAFAKFVNVDLVQNEPTLRKIEDRYRARGIPFNPISSRQALFPAGSTIVNNSAGTADGFFVEHRGALFYSLPGVPHEMKCMVTEELLPEVKRRFKNLVTPAASYLRCFGLSESAIGSLIEGCHFDPRTTISYRAHFPEVFLKFSGGHLSQEQCDEIAQRAREAVGEEHIISDSMERSMSGTVLELLKKQQLTVAFAESCTGGMAASLLVSESGASAVLVGGIVCYSNELKQKFANVSADSLLANGAVSAEVALELASGIRKSTGASIGISTTGIAGPDGGTPDKPVGTIYLGYSREGFERAVRFHLPFERNRFRHYGAHLALDLIRRDRLGLPLQFERR